MFSAGKLQTACSETVLQLQLHKLAPKMFWLSDQSTTILFSLFKHTVSVL